MESVSPTESTSPSTTAPVTAPPTESARDPDRTLMWVLLAVALLPRLLVFPVTDNLYGDSVVRTELAQQLVEDPKLISSYGDGARQFGPLQLYVTALPLALGVDRQDAGRWMSLLFGVLTILPLFRLTRRMFGRQEAILACLAFSVWGMQIQMSTTAGSEALSTFLIVSAIACFAQGWEEGRLLPLFGAAVFLNLACATRYDAWLLLPILALLLLFQGKDRVASATRAIFFGLLVCPFPLAWMQGNELAHGDPLFPIRVIEQFHAEWVGGEAGRLGGAIGYRLHNLLFWPAVAVLTLSPLVAIFCGVGMWRTWKDSVHDRWLVWVVMVPMAYFTFRAAVLMNFAPLARFTVSQLALLLPFLGPGLAALLDGRSARTRRAWLTATAVIAVATPLAMGVRTFRRDDGPAQLMRPVSPVTTNPRPVAAVADYVEQELAPGKGTVIFDRADAYLDLQVAFYSGLPESRIARVRWGEEAFDYRLTEVEPPVAVVTAEGGEFLSRADVVREEGQLRWKGVAYREVGGFPAPFTVWRRVNPAR